MPSITVEILEGRSVEQRREFVRRVTQAAVECLGSRPERVRIRFCEMSPTDLAYAGRLVSDEQANARQHDDQ